MYDHRMYHSQMIYSRYIIMKCYPILHNCSFLYSGVGLWDLKRLIHLPNKRYKFIVYIMLTYEFMTHCCFLFLFYLYSIVGIHELGVIVVR